MNTGSQNTSCVIRIVDLTAMILTIQRSREEEEEEEKGAAREV